jgi:hypothetical protein
LGDDVEAAQALANGQLSVADLAAED